MKMNYNDWFYQFHKYLEGSKGFNDTNYADIGRRYQRLIDLESNLHKEQPYGVMGNRYGFEKLLNLMGRSNYSFQDLDDALEKTYQYSLRGAMSKMLVNTHAVIFHAKNLRDKNIQVDQLSTQFVVDIPYDQLHFGERDEFIRQKLQKMHDFSNNKYIHISEFTRVGFTRILGFSILCTVNGKICNEVSIGYNDYGLRIRFAYGGGPESEVIIYKLDDTEVSLLGFYTSEFSSSIKINAGMNKYVGQTCICSFYVKDYQKTIQSIPNFGYIDNDGYLVINHVQQQTLDLFEALDRPEYDIIVYHTRFLHELEGIYPGMNYMNLIQTHKVYTDKENDVVNLDGDNIVAQPPTKYGVKDSTICTPPICLDRKGDLQFDVIRKCVGLYDHMLSKREIITHFEYVLYDPDITKRDYETLNTEVIQPLKELYDDLYSYYTAYVQGLILIGKNDPSYVDAFTLMMQTAFKLCNVSEYGFNNNKNIVETIMNDVTTDMMFDNVEGWTHLAETLNDPFYSCKELNVFYDLQDVNVNILERKEDYDKHRYNRPISEQCFIALKYDRDEQSWVFTYPTIKHFKGIENTFYIDSELRGNEVFKFFLLYTDTFYPSATIQDIDLDPLDYDEFVTEAERHLGYVRYWEVENQLMKLSRILYQTYDDLSVVHILSDILRHRIDTKDLLNTYWSNLVYDNGNVTTDNYQKYTDTSERAPFEINYLFYTLSLLNGNNDSLQAYMYRTLTDNKFDKRYIDYDIHKAFDDQPKLMLNFGYYYDDDDHVNGSHTDRSNILRDGKTHLYYGLSTPIGPSGEDIDGYAYRYVFTEGKHSLKENDDYISQKFPLYVNQGVDESYYVQSNVSDSPHQFYYDIQLAKLFTKYLNYVQDFISYFETDYKHDVNQTFALTSYRDNIKKAFTDIAIFRNNLLDENFNGSHYIDMDNFFNDNFFNDEPFVWKTDSIIDRLLMVIDPKSIISFLKNDVWTVGSNNPKHMSALKLMKRDTLYDSVGWLLHAIRTMYFWYGFKNKTIRRVKNVYGYFKRLYKPKNVYQYKQLHLQLDAKLISHIGKALIDVETINAFFNIEQNKRLGLPVLPTQDNQLDIDHLNTHGENFIKGIENNLTQLNDYSISSALINDDESPVTTFDEYDILKQSIYRAKNSYLKKIREYISNVIDNYVFDLYIIDKITPRTHHSDYIWIFPANKCTPAYVKWTIKQGIDYPKFTPPYEINQFIRNNYEGRERSLYFGVKRIEQLTGASDVYFSDGIVKTCEYVFFDGTKIDYLNPDHPHVFEAYDEDRNLVGTIECDVTFRKVGSTADLIPSVSMLLNGANTVVDLQNVHEDINEVDPNGFVVMKRTNDTHYEMLLGNNYRPLNHTYQMPLTTKDNLQGPIDRVRIPNQLINTFLLNDLGGHPGTQMFFKPSQILHLKKDSNGDITSIGGRFVENQLIYLITNDDMHYVFPAYVTAIDHSQSHGFVEARVDGRNAKWFEIKDKELIKTYIEQDIECLVLDDNISNFLDEFSNSEYESYTTPNIDMSNVNDDEVYSFPGDPVYVTNNANYVYTRINWKLHTCDDDNYLSDEHKRWRFIYMGWNQINDIENDRMTIMLLNKNRSQLTFGELYPILRDEPNDHEVWELERYAYDRFMNDYQLEIDDLEGRIEDLTYELNDLKRKEIEDNKKYTEDIKTLQHTIEKVKRRKANVENTIERIKSYLDEQEHATTWFNVVSYEAAKTYMDNHRTVLPPTYRFDMRDIPYTDDMKVYLFDWEHNRWIDPSTYTVVKNIVDHEDLDVYDDYKTSDVLRSITIVPNDNFNPSKKILIYFAYCKSDVFSSIENHDNKCKVRFKPILSTYNGNQYDDALTEDNIYRDIKLRKHIDLHEEYFFSWKKAINLTTSYEELQGLSEFKEIGVNGVPVNNRQLLYVKRNPNHTGRNPYTPKPRFCHLSYTMIDQFKHSDTYHIPEVIKFGVEDPDNHIYDMRKHYAIDDDDRSIRIYIKNPFLDTTTSEKFNEKLFDIEVIQSPDNVIDNERVKLICIDKNANYDGNVSSIMFYGTLSIDENDSINVDIKQEFIDIDDGEYVCTIMHDSSYKTTGGLFKVTVTTKSMNVMNYGSTWMMIPGEYLPYYEIPDEFVLWRHVTEDTSDHIINIDVEYDKDYSEIVANDNSNAFDPFKFYYKSNRNVRFPISDTRRSDPNRRFTYNSKSSEHRFSTTVKTSYPMVCRYSLANIPQDGLIDVTGYIPTPLSRERYEFWVNGRQLIGNTNIVILSPTSFQLINLKSLRNFELIELVDDYDDSILSNKGPVFIDTSGNVYSNFEQAMSSNKDVLNQSIRYRFNAFPNHTKLQDYTMGIIKNTNNVDQEPDIMSYWSDVGLSSKEAVDYNERYNIPTINGIQIYHPTTDDLGIHEVHPEDVLQVLDNTWKKEILTDPLFPMTHRDDTMIIDQEYLRLHCVKSGYDKFIIYTSGTYKKYFSLYLSDKYNSNISDVDHTKKIIPLIRVGTRIELSKDDVKGLYVHATVPSYRPIRIK